MSDEPTTTNEAAALVDLDPMTTELEKAGFAIVDNYPANHRLRAEALVADGKDTDPAGHITDELIAATKERVEAEAADAKAAEEAERAAAADLKRKPISELRDLAAEKGVTVAADATKAAIVDAIKSAPAGDKSEG